MNNPEQEQKFNIIKNENEEKVVKEAEQIKETEQIKEAELIKKAEQLKEVETEKPKEEEKPTQEEIVKIAQPTIIVASEPEKNPILEENNKVK